MCANILKKIKANDANKWCMQICQNMQIRSIFALTLFEANKKKLRICCNPSAGYSVAQSVMCWLSVCHFKSLCLTPCKRSLR